MRKFLFDPAGPGGGADRRGADRAVPGPDRHLQAADRQAGRECDRPQPDDRGPAPLHDPAAAGLRGAAGGARQSRPAARARRWCASRRSRSSSRSGRCCAAPSRSTASCWSSREIDLEVDAQGRPELGVRRATGRPAGAAAGAADGSRRSLRRAAPAASTRRPAACCRRSSSATCASRTVPDLQRTPRTAAASGSTAINMTLRLPDLQSRLEADGALDYKGQTVTLRLSADQPAALLQGGASPVASQRRDASPRGSASRARSTMARRLRPPASSTSTCARSAILRRGWPSRSPSRARACARSRSRPSSRPGRSGWRSPTPRSASMRSRRRAS